MSELQKSAEAAHDDEQVSLLEHLIVLAKHKALVLGLPAAAAAISAAVALLLPSYYTGVTKILPPQQTQATSSVLAQLGNLAGLAGAAAASGLKNPNDLYVGMLKSRTVADNLIQRFDLNKLYDEKYQSLTRKRLEKESTITAGRDGIITIQVDDKERRLFFERQLEQAKDSLAKSEASTRQALQKGGLVLVEGQGRVMAETSARLRAEITVKEIQIGAMRTFASDQNPELQRTQQQVEVLKRELARIEGPSGAGSSRPEETNVKGIENLRLLREMRYNEVTYELLAKQYEIAKIDEAKDSAVIQVMDRAIEPDRKSKPLRFQIVLLSTLVAGLLAVPGAFLLEASRKNNSRSAERWETLKRHIALRS